MRRNQWTGILAAVVPLAMAAGPAHAWKPKTHIYLAEQALKDALDNGRVTIYETDYKTGKIIGVLGEFPVDPRILAALRANPKQYRAGVLGPDAYPDITTGQCLIHPHQAHALDGQIAKGTNSWMTHIWNLTYGPGNLHTQGATRAFAVGYLTHAAGDLFAHTFMNHFSGGEFMLQPDPRNALKHLVVEGYVGKRTPLTIDTFGTASTLSAAAAQATFPGSSLPGLGLARLKQQGKGGLPELMRISRELEGAIVTENDVSIDGLETFLAGELTFGRPGSVLYDKLLNVDERKKSLPYIFSTLRNSLQAEIDRYYKRGKLDRIKYSATHPGRITFLEHWVKDIDKGLIQWPKTSHELAKALVYNETGGGVDIKGARAAIDNYVKNYLVYMGPVPDIAVDVFKLMGKIMEAIVPAVLKESIDEMVKDFRNWTVQKATGKTLDEWAEYLSNPEVHFDPILNNGGGDRPGRTASRVSLADFNRDHLKLSDTGFTDGTTETFEIEKLPPAFNTVQMCKLLLLNKAGVNQLLDTLAAKGIKRPTLPANFENVMLGWHQSLDNDNQWQGLASRDANPRATLVFAQDGGATYQRLFLKQVGEVDWVRESATTPGGATNPPPPGVPSNPPSTNPPPPGVPANPTPAIPSPAAVQALFAGLKGTWKTTRGTILTIADAETTDGSLKLRGSALRKNDSGTTTHLETIYLEAQTETSAGGMWVGLPNSSSLASNGRVSVTLAADGESFTGTVTTQDGAMSIYNGTRVKPDATTPGTTLPPATGGESGNAGNGNGGVVPPGGGPARIGDGKFHELNLFDIKLDRAQMGRGNTLELFVTYRSRSRSRVGVTAGVFQLLLTDTDGVGIAFDGNLYRVGGEDPVRLSATVWLEPREECRVRYLFHLPQGTEALKRLTIREYSQYPVVADLADLALTRP